MTIGEMPYQTGGQCAQELPPGLHFQTECTFRSGDEGCNFTETVIKDSEDHVHPIDHAGSCLRHRLGLVAATEAGPEATS